jgi:hypothetical protein
VIRRLLPTVLVGESLPLSPAWPLGAFDGEAGLRLARLDPANAVDLQGAATEPARTRRCIERTLSLFEIRNADVEPMIDLIWNRPDNLFYCAGRRVVVYRPHVPLRLAELPPLRWIHMAGSGEPHEVCSLPDLRSGWYSRLANCEAVSRWLEDERKRAEAVASASLGLGDSLAYDPVRGEFSWAERSRMALAGEREGVARRELVDCGAGLPRWAGTPGALSGLEHALVVGRLAARWGGPAAGLGGMVHDLHEAISADMRTPVKRLMRVCGDVWDEIDEVAQGAVTRLFGVELSAEDREVVRLADLCSLAAEARRLGQVLVGQSARVRALSEERVAEAWGEIDEVVGAIARRMVERLDDLQPRDAAVDVWWREWTALGGQR